MIRKDDHILRRISVRRFYKLLINEYDAQPLLEYADQRVRTAFLLLELENRKPTAINRIDRSFYNFDANGRIDQDDLELRRSFSLFFDALV